jgi:hypothetical protein
MTTTVNARVSFDFIVSSAETRCSPSRGVLDRNAGGNANPETPAHRPDDTSRPTGVEM